MGTLESGSGKGACLNSADCERDYGTRGTRIFVLVHGLDVKNIISWCSGRPGSRIGAFSSRGADRYVWANTCGAIVVEEEDIRGTRLERTEINRRDINHGGDVDAAEVCDIVLALIAHCNVLDGIRVVALQFPCVFFALPHPQSPSSPDGVEKKSYLGSLRGLNWIGIRKDARTIPGAIGGDGRFDDTATAFDEPFDEEEFRWIAFGIIFRSGSSDDDGDRTRGVDDFDGI